METVQTNRQLRRKVRHDKGRSAGTKRKAQERTALPFANGFLNSTFLPMVMGRACLNDWKEIQKDFFESYHHFVSRYGLTPINYSNKIYPHNIALAYRQVREYMEQYSNEGIMIADHLYSKCCITTIKPYDTNMTLYYIPLRPLHRLQNDRSKRSQCDLLLSVCSYLMDIARIPSYQYGDYVGTCYEMIKDWTESEPEDWADKRDYYSALSEFKQADYFGGRLMRQLKSKCHLQQWENRLHAFRVANEFDAAVFMVAEEAYHLYCNYPQRRFYENICPEWHFPEQEERTRPDQYLSFTWSESGWLSDQLFQMVNSDLMENGVCDEPLFIRTFDQKDGVLMDELDFEKRLFALINNLSDILYNLSDE